MTSPPRSYRELVDLSDDQLIELFDRTAPNTAFGVSLILRELDRRQSKRQTEQLLALTRWITAMTLVILLATVLNVIAFGVSLLR